jgi:hypothetical protein
LPKLLYVRPDNNTPIKLIFRALSIAYHYKVVFGSVAAVEEAELVRNLGLPTDAGTVLWFPVGQQSSAPTPIRFKGPLKGTNVAKFIESNLKPTLAKSEIKEVSDQRGLEDFCMSGGKFNRCVIVLADKGSESVASMALESILKEEVFARGFAFSKIKCPESGKLLRRNLNIAEDYPTALLIDLSEKQYALMGTEFSPTSFEKFLSAGMQSGLRFFKYSDFSKFTLDAEESQDRLEL